MSTPRGIAVCPAVLVTAPLLIVVATLVCCCGARQGCPGPSAVEAGDNGSRPQPPDQEVLDLVAQLDDPAYEVRLKAIERLTELGARASSAALSIVAALGREPEEWVRSSYVDLLAAMGSAEPPVLDLYAALLSHEELSMRSATANAVKMLGPKAGALLSHIVSAFERHPELHTDLLRSLQAMIPDSKVAVPAVLDAMKNHDLWPGGLFLGDLGPEGAVAVPELVAILEDPLYSDELRGASAHALGRIGDSRPAVLEALQTAQDAGIEGAGDALRALGAK